MANAFELMQAEMAKRPRPNADFRPVGDDRLRDITDIPMDPSHPGWKSKIPPPADPGPQVVAAGQEQQVQPTTGDKRVVIYYTPRGYRLGIETAPTWDIDGRLHTISESAIREFLPILQQIIKVKDTTGEFDVAEERQQGTVERLPRSRPRTSKPKQSRTEAHQSSGDQTTRAGNATDSERSDTPGLGLQTGDEALPGWSVPSNSEGQNSRVVDAAALKIIEQEIRAKAYKTHSDLKRAVGIYDEEVSRVGTARSSG